MNTEMLQIRWHGRGGQGAKTAATLIAEVAIGAGNYAQGSPQYGAERQGAPMRAYTRISDKPIREHDAIYAPGVVVVLDETLLESEAVAEGMTEDGMLLVNSKNSPEQIRERLSLEQGRIYAVDGTGIALDEVGKPIPNTVMIGALLKITGALSMEDVEKDIRKKLRGKLSEEALEGNVNAVHRAYEEVRSENG